MIPKLAENFPAIRVKRKRLARIGKLGIYITFLLNPLLISSAAELGVSNSTPVFTTVRAVRHLAESGRAVACAIRLEGAVLWARPDREQFIFQDDSGGMSVEMDLRSQQLLQTGQHVLLEGGGLVGPNGFRAMLINNDGIHPAMEKSESLYLAAGRHAIGVGWFNALKESVLGVSFEGPGLSRQPIPDSALFHVRETSDAFDGGKTNWENGLIYRCYEGSWKSVPAFQTLAVRKSGIVSNFDLTVRTRDENVGLQFSGFIDVPRTGLYTFWDKSDDGSYVSIDEYPLRVSVIDGLQLPPPRQISAGQLLAEGQDCQWSEIEGTVIFAGKRSGSMDLELNSGTGLMHLEVKEASAGFAPLLVNSRIRVTGISQSIRTTDNQRVGGMLLVPSLEQIKILEPAPAFWAERPIVPIGRLAHPNFSGAENPIIQVGGKVLALNPDDSFLVQDMTGQILVKTAQDPPPISSRIEVLGQLTQTATNFFLRSGFYRATTNLATGNAFELPLLTRIEQVKSLGQEEAQKGYPVKIQGIVTALTPSGFFIQDATWAIYVRSEGLMLSDLPQTGDLWEVDGVTYAEFSPNIQAKHAIRLDAGVLPAPIHPTLDQLVNGSMDTRYVEIQGIVMNTESDTIQLLTHEGRVKVALMHVDPQNYGQPDNDLKKYENALIRIRGCVIPGRDVATERVQMGQFFLCNYLITMDQPAPLDAFSLPLKNVADLHKFDPHASILQLVRVAGQILHEQGTEFFLWDGTNGLRFAPRAAVHLQVGDTVEVVGFPDLGRRSPILREALVRCTGHGTLPSPRLLSNAFLLNWDYDSSLVRIQASLTEISSESSEQVLTLQAGAHGFIARSNIRAGLRPDLLLGSRLELTGVYAGQSGDSTSDAAIDSFELLLNSPADMVILERPGWWTLQRLVMAFGMIAVVLAGAILWIFTLRRRVNAQTLIIHQKVEREATLEERTRIARDIHDTLEQALAGTSFQLNALERSLDKVPQEPIRILAVARSMVRHAQEEAWRTVQNLRLLDLEKQDLPTALSRLATAQSGADSPIQIVVNVKGTIRALPSQVEAHLLRISQESITNTIKHARTKTVQLELCYETGWLQLTIHDDGCGFEVAHAVPTASGHFGLLGMRERAEKIGGTLQIQSAPGKGTTIQVRVLLPPSIAELPHSNPVSKNQKIT